MESSKKTGVAAAAAVRTVSSGRHASTAVIGSAKAFVTADNSPCTAFAVAAAAVGDDNLTTNNNIGGEEDVGVIAAPADILITSSFEGAPAEIPPEPTFSEAGLGGDGDEEDDREEEDDDESEYEYEDDEDAAYSGFLVDHPPLATTTTTTNAEAGSESSPARIRDEDESDTAAEQNRKMKWREPSKEAVSMSLRAEKEKTGSKRRLAKDLYRIMNQDTEEAGFSIGPKSEDNMDHWIIKLFMFDPDSNLAKDMVVLGFEHVELEMTFPDQYPFEPPFVRVSRPRFKRQTGFVMNGALCMELLTKDGWNPVNDIESVIVSIRSLLVVGDGRLQAAHDMSESKYQARLKANSSKGEEDTSRKRQKHDDETEKRPAPSEDGGSYSVSEAHAAYSHLSDYHKKKGWDSSGWWARKG